MKSKVLMEFGEVALIRHEQEIVSVLLSSMSTIPGLTLYVKPELYFSQKRIGTIPFNLAGYHHSLLAAILDEEYGIEVRAGTICNHRLVRRWLKVDDAAQTQIEQEISQGNRLATYGVVRASVGLGSTIEDADRLVAALRAIRKYGPKYQYRPNPALERYERI